MNLTKCCYCGSSEVYGKADNKGRCWIECGSCGYKSYVRYTVLDAIDAWEREMRAGKEVPQALKDIFKGVFK